MHKVARVLLTTAVAGLGIATLAVFLVLAAMSTPQGRQAVERLVLRLSGGEVMLSGLSGRFPDVLHADRIEVRDGRGNWLLLNDITLRWSATQLLAGRIRIDHLECSRLLIQRLPDYPPDTEQTDWFPGLPIRVKSLRIPQLDLARDVIGHVASLAVTASGRFDAPQRFAVNIAIRRRDGEGRYRAEADMAPTRWGIDLDVAEPPHGLLATWAGLTELGQWSLRGRLDGPPSSAQTDLQLHAGELRAEGRGMIDFQRQTLDLHLDASSPELRWRNGYSWHAASLSAWIQGPYLQPRAGGMLLIERPQAGDSSSERIAADLSGDAEGNIQVRAELTRLRIPGPKSDLFGTAPIVVEAGLRLGHAEAPLSFSLNHPLLRAAGQAHLRGDMQGNVALHLPDLAPFAALAALDLRGKLDVNLQGSHDGDQTHLLSRATAHLSGGEPPLISLLGDQVTVVAGATIRPPELAITQFELKGKQIQLSAAHGRYSPAGVAGNWKVLMPDLGVLAPDVYGRVTADGHLAGTPQNLTVTTQLKGDAGSKLLSGGPFTSEIELHGLPDATTGSGTLKVQLSGSPLAASWNFAPQATGGYRVTLEKANWSNAWARGVWTVSPKSWWPVGYLEFGAERLDALSALVGLPLSGSIAAKLATEQRGKEQFSGLQATGTALGIGELRIGGLRASASLHDDGRQARVEGTLGLTHYAVGALSGDAMLTYEGPIDAVPIRLSATATGVGYAPVDLDGTITLDTRGSQLHLHALQARWQGETLRLKVPARVMFADGVTIENLALKVRNAELRASGRVNPTLDLDARMSHLPVDLAAALLPDMHGAKGTIDAECRLAGPYDRLRGNVRFSVSGFQMAQGAGLGLPPAELSLAADLAGGGARLDARLRAGPLAVLSARGDMPFTATGAIDLDADGSIDLKILDGWLTPRGQRARGVLSLRSRARGAASEPRIEGDLQFLRGDFQDFALGLRVNELTAQAHLDGDAIHLTRFDGKMTPGRVTAVGTLALREAGYPFRLKITARNARPLSNERLNVTLDSELELHRETAADIDLAGTINIRRAEIRIPERMPARIAVLDVRKPDALPPPPPAPPPTVGLNLTIDAPAEIFVRGRGLDAELAGKVRLQGSVSDPEPTGAFRMRRGEFKLAGRTLTFSKGELGFDGGTLTDPSMDFIASTASPNVSATLAVGGTASKPKISLSSVPELPQDEILAQLLFGRNAASLGPLELAEIASALASLTGVTGNLTNPLDWVRRGLGLDRLSMGSDKAGPTLEAGRYVAPGIYLGAKQGFTGATPSAAVQIDVTEGLKLEGTVGTGSPTASQSGTTSVGVIYQFEY